MKNIDEDLITTETVPTLSEKGIAVQVLRLDKIHPVISGNKWFKLRLHIETVLRQRQKTVLTFGGAYSNHIVATAAACAQYRLKSVGLIRGERPTILSHTLQTAAQFGMQFVFLSREAYRTKGIPAELDPDNCYIIPEGGYGPAGAEGAARIPYRKEDFDVVACAVGTGTMMAGLMNGRAPQCRVIGISVLKNHHGLEAEVINLLKDRNQPVTIHHDYHFGGYAKHRPELIDFMNTLFLKTGIPTDFVYTAKLFFGIQDLISKGHFANGTRVLLIHSGGLQGNFSLRKGTLIF